MTVLNERTGAEAFVKGLLQQTRFPDEVVILDGGSTDGTAQYLRRELSLKPFRLTVLVDWTCNIKFHRSPVARGRNQAIQYAKGDIIAVTDAECFMAPDWIEKLVEPFEASSIPDIDVASGIVKPMASNSREDAFGAVLGGSGGVEDPSSRSVAFRRSTWAEFGGYPEITLTAEDSAFNDKLRFGGCRFVGTGAVVYWRPPATWRKFLRQVYRYSKGDAMCGLHAGMYLRKALTLGLLSLTRDHPFTRLVADWVRIAGYIAGLMQAKSDA